MGTPEQAKQGIEGDVVLRFRHADGTPASGVHARITQQSHDFAFGCPFRPRHYRDYRQLQLFQQLFNFVELLEFNWGQYEPDEGKPLLEERRQFIRLAYICAASSVVIR